MNSNSPNSKFTEAELEEAIIDLFREQDYYYVQGDLTSRRYDDALIEEDLRNNLTYLINLYS